MAFVTVLISDYKVWLYRALENAPEIDLTAIHGPERPGTAPRDAGRLGLRKELIVRHRFFLIGPVELTWIPAVLWVARERPDVLVLQDGVRIASNWLMHIIARFTGRKVVYYSHGFNHQGRAWRAPWLHQTTERFRQLLLRHSDGVFVYSTAGKEHLESSHVRTPITVVGNMIDGSNAIRRAEQVTAARIAEIRRQHGVPAEGILIVGLGRLVEEKRHDVFIATIELISRILGAPVAGLVAGEGPLRQSLEERARGTQTKFLGHVAGAELSELLASADLVFLPGMVGLAIVEAFCAGAPFVAVDRSDHSPEIEHLRDGITGLLLRDEDPEGLANQLARALESGHLKELGTAARQYAREHFNGDTVTRKFIEALLDLEGR